MILRFQDLNTSQNCFLFGARGTGKSTLIKKLFPAQNTLWIDLLNYKQESTLSKNPDRLSFLINSGNFKKVVIDEIQKIPKLLDIVHKETEKRKEIQFIMTGSSARKLKRGQANLLAGRAIAYYLYPLSCFELDQTGQEIPVIKEVFSSFGPDVKHEFSNHMSINNQFKLLPYLQLGGLPKLLALPSHKEKILFLESYVQNYLKEEILQEQIIRQIQPFKNFLEVSAQINGQTINFSKCAREVGVDHKTIQNYFSVLEDTLIGFFLPAYHRSVRKQQQKSPKFFLFDTGVQRALTGQITLPLKPNTYAFGQAFEHFIIMECHKLNHYFGKRYRFSYLKTKEGQEVDLIIQRPGQKDMLVEIKSSREVREEHIKTLKRLSLDWPSPVQAQLWSLDSEEQKIQNIHCLYWKKALKKLFFF